MTVEGSASSARGLIGREAELGALAKAIAASALTTVLGPPGVGKSRLVRTALDESSELDLVVVELDHVADREGLASAIATNLGLTGLSARAARDPRWLVETIGRRSGLLLVLDGADGCLAPVREALGPWRDGTEAKIVVTSRSVLGLSHESIVEVRPLSIDAAALLFSVAAERAGSPVSRTDAAVRRIAAAVDCIPLALELAAGRLRVLDVRELADRLEKDATLVGGGLEAAMKSAIDALDPEPRAVLARCSAFAGSFTLRAVEAIAGPRAADALALLRNRSLVVAEPGEVLALRLPAFVRVFGRRELGSSGLAEVEARLFEHLAAALPPIAAEHARTGSARARAAIALHRADLLAMRQTRDPRLALEAAVLLCAAFAEEQPLEAREWISLAMVDAATGIAADRVLEALARIAEVALEVRDVEGARRAIDRAPEGSARIRVLASRAAWHAGEIEASRALAEAAEEAAIDARDRTLEAEAIALAGRAKSTLGEDETAVRLGRAALQIAREVRHPGLEARVSIELGVCERSRGSLEVALRLFEEAAAIGDEIGASRLEVFATSHAGWTLAGLGRLEEAELRHRHAVERGRTIGLDAELGWPLLGLGCCLLERGDASALEEAIACGRRSRQPRIAALAAALTGARFSTGAEPEPLELGFADLDAAVDLAGGREHEARGVLADFVRRTRARSGRAPVRELEPAADGTLVALADGGAFRVAPGPWIELPLRSPLRRVLKALVDARIAEPGSALDMRSLIDVAWPDEKILPIAARNRLYMAISKLRTLGLGEALGRSTRGYALDPAVPIERNEPLSSPPAKREGPGEG